MRPMRLVRWTVPWFASAALHATVAAAAVLTFAGMAERTPDDGPREAIYSVTVDPGGSGPQVTEAPTVGSPGYAMEMERVPIDDAPLAAIPELNPSGVRIEGPAAPDGKGGAGAAAQGFSRAPHVKLGSGSGSAVAGSGSGTGTGTGVGSGKDPGIEAIPLETPSPVYPDTARRKHLEGTVIAEIRIDTQGRIESARAAEGSGSELLDDAALAAVRA